MNRILIALALVLCAAVAVPAVAHQGKGKSKGKRPDVIALPNGFQPEGITTWKRHTFFVGSRDNGAIYRGNLRTGEGAILVPGADPSVPNDDRAATGLKVDRFGRLFASGADSHVIRVYDARTGAEIRNYPVAGSGFINDVIITRRGAYFTDSNVPQLYFIPFGKKGALGELQRIPITGDFKYTAGLFNANGIEKARGGKTLILISSHDGALYTADAATGVTKRIAVTGMDGELKNGDGIMRKGRKLYVVENRDGVAEGVTEGTGEVSVVRLSRNLRTGTIVREISDARFDVPTTIARSGGRNYVVNAKFNTPPTPTTPYEVVKVPRK
jgi:outer membrane protein assembly factor BamB